MALTIEELGRHRRTVDTKLATIKSEVDALSPDTASLVVVQKHMKKLEEYEAILEEAFTKAGQLCDDATFKTWEPLFVASMRTVSEVLCKTLELQEKLTRKNSPPKAAAKTVEVKLPKLDLPSFSGDRLEWMTFRDLFSASIHNNSNLTGAQKLQYLKKALQDEALAVVKQFACTDGNYIKAWGLLENRDIITTGIWSTRCWPNSSIFNLSRMENHGHYGGSSTHPKNATLCWNLSTYL